MQPKTLAKRIRKNLINQKQRLEKYLDVIEKEKHDLIIEAPDQLIEHINLEKSIIDELSAFKKILAPLEVLYFSSPYKKDFDIITLKNNINLLTKQVKEKSLENKERLETILLTVKVDLKKLNKKKMTKITYDNSNAQFVDIKG